MKLPSELARVKIFMRPFAIRSYLSRTEKPRLHIGCGDNVVDGWLNADKFNSLADIYINVYRRFPFDDETFECAYCEHVLEHLAIEKVRHFLAETYRVLKPGGIFRITVPDLELFARKYVEGDGAFFKPYLDRYAEKTRNGERKTWVIRSHGSAFMSLANLRFFHHRWMYDFETIAACAQEIGFANAVKGSFKQGLSEDVAGMDSAFRESETVYVDLVR